MGDNKIKQIEGLDNCLNITEIFMAKNQLTSISGISHLPNLSILALQANQITQLSGLENLETLEEIYLQQNLITKIENLQDLTSLEVLDLAYNKVQVIEGLETQKETMKELWLNWNAIEEETSINYLSTLANIETVYIADNPVIKKIQNVKDLILSVAPKIKQIDGNMLRT